MPGDATLERPLPHNLEAERSILGAILLDNHALNAAIEKVRSDDFFLPQHRQIFERMVQLGEKQQAIDIVTLMEDLSRRGELVQASNDERLLTAIIPSANVVTTANELARFYEIFRRGGELDGVRVMRPETVRNAMTEQSHLEVDLSLGFPTRFGYGLMLGSQLLSLYGRDTQHAFGHLGFTNILAWADDKPPLTPVAETPWQGRWGKGG